MTAAWASLASRVVQDLVAGTSAPLGSLAMAIAVAPGRVATSGISVTLAVAVAVSVPIAMVVTVAVPPSWSVRLMSPTIRGHIVVLVSSERSRIPRVGGLTITVALAVVLTLLGGPIFAGGPG